MRWVTRRNVKVDRVACPWLIARGFAATAADDAERLARQFPMYDALYAHCRRQSGSPFVVGCRWAPCLRVSW